MAKEDFCFVYYDGDAARDKAHMSRLERGAYDDLISAQRKRGHLSLDDIKKVLSKDFEECWPSLQWVLKIDAEQKYFIEWVDKSLEIMRANAKKNKDRIEEYWRKKKAGESIPQNESGNTKSIPRNNHGIITEEPLENENEDVNEDEIVFRKKGVTGEKTLIVPAMMEQFKEVNPQYPDDEETDFPQLKKLAEKIHKGLSLKGLFTDRINAEKIKLRWGDLIDHIKADQHFSGYSLSQINKYYQSIVQSESNGRTKADKQLTPAKLGTSEARIEALKNYSITGGK